MTTYSHYQSTYTSPFAIDKIESRIILKLIGKLRMRERRKPKFDNTTKPAKRNERKIENNTRDLNISQFA